MAPKKPPRTDCPHCGVQNTPGAVHCKDCGKRIQKDTFIPSDDYLKTTRGKVTIGILALLGIVYQIVQIVYGE